LDVAPPAAVAFPPAVPNAVIPRCLLASDAGHTPHWDALVEQAPLADVYHRTAYAQACEAASSDTAIGLTLDAGDQQVLLPLLLRPLGQLPFVCGERGFDAITPYGYGGLLPVGGRERPPTSQVRALLHALRTWCRHMGVVSCFIRLHPLLGQDRWLAATNGQERWWSLQQRGSTVALDLASWDMAQQRIAGMRRDRRLDLNHARRSLRVTWSGVDLPLPDALAQFQLIYEKRMAQLNAGAHYFFPAKYYAALAAGLSRNLAVALAWQDGLLVGASLFLAKGQFAHYHLSAANDAGRKAGAPTLLINAGAQWARERGHRFLHLGGGVRPADSLFEYKLSFGGGMYPYHTLQIVADESRYLDLFERRLRCASLPALREGFFPHYRA
jgi:hypothetical protein